MTVPGIEVLARSQYFQHLLRERSSTIWCNFMGMSVQLFVSAASVKVERCIFYYFCDENF